MLEVEEGQLDMFTGGWEYETEEASNDGNADVYPELLPGVRT